MVMFIYFIVMQSGVIAGADIATDKMKESSLSQAYRNTVIEGTITDSEGTVIVSSADIGDGGKCFYPSFSYLVGYNSARYGTFGLRGRYEKYLFIGGEENRGATIKLTARCDVQDYAASLISDIDGSAIVMEKKTGRLLALASHSAEDFNVDLIEDRMEHYNSIDGFFYTNGYRDSEPPGSTFKMVTASAMIENAMENATWNDNGKAVFGNTVIHNAGDAAYGELTLRDAFAKSSNTYFSTMAVRLGADTLTEKANDFLIGEPIALDFTTLYSNFDLTDDADAQIALAGFGQGKTQITPLHIAMIAQSIGNGGVMLKPYLVDSISLDDHLLIKGRTKRLAEPVSRDTADKVAELMHYTAVEEYGFSEEECGRICAKTGTAELTNGSYHAYFVSFNDDYVVLFSANNTDVHGSGLKERAKKMYAFLKTTN